MSGLVGVFCVKQNREFRPRIEELKLMELMETNFTGCPICQTNVETVRNSIFGILYEMVNDPGIRAQFRKKRLCYKHAYLLVQVLEESRFLGHLGISIILKDIVDHVRFPRPVKRIKERSRSFKCYFCELEDDANRRHVSIFANMMSHSAIGKMYMDSTSILCIV